MKKQSYRIMVVDDELSMREFLEIALMKEGYTVEVAPDPRVVLARLEQVRFDLIISDMRMPHMSGIELLAEVKRIDPEIGMIMITAFSDTDQAVQAMKIGADDYIPKPFKLDELKIVIQSVLEKRHLKTENRLLKVEVTKHRRENALIGESQPMRRLKELISRVANSRTNILITGESGTGKELVARAIHLESDRCNRTFLAVNCGAIPRDLMESEFFGHMRGSFTGAHANKPGFFEAADGGTLFLDEIGELPMELQVKLLRVLQDQVVMRVGATEPIQVDVRVLAATNRNLENMVSEGQFREDLFYRVNVISLDVPALRDRNEDIPMLVAHFLEKSKKQQGKDIEGIQPEAMEMFQKYPFPGNVRELENLIERCVALSSEGLLDVDSLPQQIYQAHDGKPAFTTEGIKLPLDGKDLDMLVNEFEKKLVERALEKAGGNRRAAGKLLGISERSLRYKIDKHNVFLGD